METQVEAKFQSFLQWLQLRGCQIKYCNSRKGFGLFSAEHVSDGVLLVVPLDLAITPMRVLQDSVLGPECRAMFEEGDVDDRFLMILFLTVERLRKNSSWKPYIDMLPTTFSNPLWFSDVELLELKGTALHKATVLQKKKLQSLYDEKVKFLVDKILNLHGDPKSEVCFVDFLWANSVFWTRALNIPFPHCYVFPQNQGQHSSLDVSGTDTNLVTTGEMINGKGKRPEDHESGTGVTSTSLEGKTVWVEGLVPGIDFCNHDLKAAATWEVDGTGSTTGVPFSMYLLSATDSPYQIEREISISYGNKGNEELLYLYGFVIDNNPDDYLMVHYPVDALQNVLLWDSKARLLEEQKAELRCLLPRSLLDDGCFRACSSEEDIGVTCRPAEVCSYSWSGQRKKPAYSSKLVFPEDFLTALRTIAMQEDELAQVLSLLTELVGSREDGKPSHTDVRAAVWEACGDSGAFQLLVDLLNTRMMDLEDGSGKEVCDNELLEKAVTDSTEDYRSEEINSSCQQAPMSTNRWSSIVYRRGQKQLTRLFLKEAEHALQLSISEEN